MLDQNTDRMWYVIGALVVGAGIILLANKAMPEVFANVTDSFNSVASGATYALNNEFVYEDIIDSNDVEIYEYGKLINYDASSDTWTIEIPGNMSTYGRGLKIKPSAVAIPYGKTLMVSYEVWIPKGSTELFYAPDINNSYENTQMENVTNNNDVLNNREYGYIENGKHVVYTKGGTPKPLPLQDGEWTTVWYSYENNSSLNKNKINLYDYSTIGVLNGTGQNETIKIRNIFGYIVKDKN